MTHNIWPRGLWGNIALKTVFRISDSFLCSSAHFKNASLFFFSGKLDLENQNKTDFILIMQTAIYNGSISHPVVYFSFQLMTFWFVLLQRIWSAGAQERGNIIHGCFFVKGSRSQSACLTKPDQIHCHLTSFSVEESNVHHSATGVLHTAVGTLNAIACYVTTDVNDFCHVEAKDKLLLML